MASVFKKRTTRPLPEGAEIIMRKGERIALSPTSCEACPSDSIYKRSDRKTVSAGAKIMQATYRQQCS